MLIIEYFGFFNDFDGAEFLGAARNTVEQGVNWLEMKYEEAPALVLGVGFASALPVIAVLGAVLRMMFRKRTSFSETPRTVRTRPASAWRQTAFLELPDSNAAGYQIGQGIVRIGRETDNDLCLSDPTVHRYHAVLEHTPEAEYILSYVGDPDNDGLYVNGRPVQRERLRGGDVLEIGSIKLRFELSAA